MAWAATACLTLPTIGSDVGIGGTFIVYKGGGAFEVDPSAPTGSWAFITTVGCTSIATSIDTWSCFSAVGRYDHSIVDHQVGRL